MIYRRIGSEGEQAVRISRGATSWLRDGETKRSRKTVVAFVTVALGAAIMACSTVLGFEDLVPYEAPLDVFEAGSETGFDSGQPDADSSKPDVVEDTSPETSQQDVEQDVEQDVGCGDTDSDPDHCGRCNHSCLGGDCLNGVCQPIELATTLFGAFGLAVHDTYLCVAIENNNVVSCMNKDGEPYWSMNNYEGGAKAPVWVALDDTHVFWSNRDSNTGSIAVCEIDSCQKGTEILKNLRRPNGVAVDGEWLYFAETVGGTIKSAPKDGSSTQDLVLESMGWAPFLITLHKEYLYFSERSTFDNRIGRIPLTGGPIQVLGGSSLPAKIAVTNEWVYWTNSENAHGTVYRVPNENPPAGGHSPQIVAGNQDVPFGIAVDEEYVYWIERGSKTEPTGTLRACPLSGCPNGQPMTLDQDLHHPTDVVVDDDAVYYSIYGSGQLMQGAIRKIAKP